MTYTTPTREVPAYHQQTIGRFNRRASTRQDRRWMRQLYRTYRANGFEPLTARMTVHQQAVGRNLWLPIGDDGVTVAS